MERSAAAVRRIAVAMHAPGGEPPSELVSAFSANTEVILLAPNERASAEVVVVLAEVTTDDVVDELAALSSEAVNNQQRIVLVAGPLQERHLPKIFGAGVVSILPHRETTPRQIIRAVVASDAGRSVMPDVLVRWLADELRAAQNILLTTYGLAPGGVTVREVEILKLLAQGDDTGRIAANVGYSDRTIKKILQDMMSRLNLRSRAHAVSYAMRVGAI